MRINLKNEARDIKQLIDRFPLPCCIAVLFTLTLVYLINLPFSSDTQWIGKTLITLVAAFFYAAGLSVLCEGVKSKPHLAHMIGWGVFLVFAFLSVSSAQQADDMLPLVAVSFVSFLVMPFFKQIDQGKAVILYTAQVQRRVLFIFFISLILSLALGLLITSFFFLFGLGDLDDHLVFSYLAIITGFVAPLLGLAGIPKTPTQSINRHNAEAFLVNSITTPFIVAYGAIILLYAIKITLQQSLPEGIIGAMTAPFLLTSFYVYLFAYGIEKDTAITRFFKRYYPVITFPAIMLLAVGLAVRIGDYGLTEPRYYIGLILVLSTISTGIITFLRDNRRIPFILLATLMGLLLLSLVPPMSAHTLSKQSQTARMVDAAHLLAITKTGIIQPVSGQTLTANEITSQFQLSLGYLLDNDHDDTVYALIPSLETQDYLSTYDVMTHLNIALSSYDNRHDASHYFTYEPAQPGKAIAIKGYDYIATARLYPHEEQYQVILPSDIIRVSVDFNDAAINLNDERLDVSPFIHDLIAAQTNTTHEPPTYNVIVRDGLSITVVITALNGMQKDTQTRDIHMIEMRLLIKATGD